MRVLVAIGASADDAEAVATSCRPFAADRAGFALGEAAAAFVGAVLGRNHVRNIPAA
jgi:3-oxoacyl-(acyl-carrier-protein) synthase